MSLKNALRHRLRAVLTLTGLTIAILAFGMLRTVIGAWYAGADAASDNRLVTRSSISLVFSLPISYAERLRSIDGVNQISWANWFGGIYLEPKNFFPQFAIDPASYLALYPEYRLPEDERLAFIRDRRGAIVGRQLADRFGWKVGDIIPMKGTIFPGNWPLTVRGIYDGRDKGTKLNQMFFHWNYINERLKEVNPRRANQTGVFIVGIRDGSAAAAISERIDAEFKNSLAETLTETENAFQLSFVAQTEAIVIAIKIVSFVVIIIIMAVMANTMAMAARERTAEYATLKALGFAPGVIGWLILAEAITLCAIGGGLGILLTFPVVGVIAKALQTFLPVINVSSETLWMQCAAALLVALVSAMVPAWQSMRVKIVDGLRAIA